MAYQPLLIYLRVIRVRHLSYLQTLCINSSNKYHPSVLFNIDIVNIINGNNNNNNNDNQNNNYNNDIYDDNTFIFSPTSGPATGRNGSVTFKDVVEAFAANNGVTFMPKAGRMHEGRQIWLFGTSLCYLDQDVVFTFVSENNWRPIGLEELLKLS